MIVGTHIDLIDHFPKKKTFFEQEIEYYYSNTAFYPEIKAITFVSYKGKSKHAVSKLCHKLYDIAASMEAYLGYYIYNSNCNPAWEWNYTHI